MVCACMANANDNNNRPFGKLNFTLTCVRTRTDKMTITYFLSLIGGEGVDWVAVEWDANKEKIFANFRCYRNNNNKKKTATRQHTIANDFALSEIKKRRFPACSAFAAWCCSLIIINVRTINNGPKQKWLLFTVVGGAATDFIFHFFFLSFSLF